MPDCILCDRKLKLKYLKKNNNREYLIYACAICRFWQLSPIPSMKDLSVLYQNNYFKTRTDRGYDDYLSDKVSASIKQTFKKNLKQLNFYDWEQQDETKIKKSVLDVGCAAGYFVEYLQDRGWRSEGIDIAPKMVAAGQKKGLNIKKGDFLKTPYPKESYDLITLWASLEHLPNPEDFIRKFYNLLKPGGHVYISTCHIGFWAKIYRKNWRFLNVPEHIWFFSHKSIKKYFERYSFRLNTAFTYGSGLTSQNKISFMYKIIKKIADFVAKYFFLGDMIVCDFIKIEASDNKSSINSLLNVKN